MTAQMKWILAICGLLAVNVIACVVLAVVAGSETNQVIPDYYAKASHYDDQMARAAASQRLGWKLDVAVTGEALDASLRDASGLVIDDAQVRITGYPRAHAAEKLDIALRPVDGHYRAARPVRRGWYDLVVDIDARGTHDTRTIAIEAP